MTRVLAQLRRFIGDCVGPVKLHTTQPGSRLELIRAYGLFWRVDEVDWYDRRRSVDFAPSFALCSDVLAIYTQGRRSSPIFETGAPAST
jgi:hypothetical protein